MNEKKEKRSRSVHESRGERANPYSWGFRNHVQLGVFLLTIGIGLHFFIYVLQATGDGPVTLSRPPGVEGFLPIGALMGWKVFVLSGEWDHVHPAAIS